MPRVAGCTGGSPDPAVSENSAAACGLRETRVLSRKRLSERLPKEGGM